jgi:DNA-binding transcriptional LysR family regulator
LPQIAHLVKRELPEVVLDIHTEMLTPGQQKALLEGRIDVGLLRPPVRQDGIAVRTIAREPLVLVVRGVPTGASPRRLRAIVKTCG